MCGICTHIQTTCAFLENNRKYLDYILKNDVKLVCDMKFIQNAVTYQVLEIGN